MKKPAAILLLFLAFLLPACTGRSQPTPAAIAPQSPTENPLPTIADTLAPANALIASDTPQPIKTSPPTNTPAPTPVPTLALGDVQTVEEGGYSFRPPKAYPVGVSGQQVGIFDPNRTLIISIVGSKSNPQGKTPEEIAQEFLGTVFRQGQGEYELGEPYPVTVDGVEGLGFDLTGSLTGLPYKGQAVIVMPSKIQFLFGVGLSEVRGDQARWENEGQRVFKAMIDSITFARPSGAAADGCVISTDDTYGYTDGNPIKVGGGLFDGPSRARAYLDNLLGPNGEALTYEHTGSVRAGDAVLEVYEIRGLDKTISLYIDLYAFVEPQAPASFTCVTAFPLLAP